MDKCRFQNWKPLDSLGTSYDVENTSWGKDGISFTIVSYDKSPEKYITHRFRLIWASNSIISYHVTDETYRSDCWNLDVENNGRFYTSMNSDYIASLRQKSPLFPEKVIHFLIVGTDTIIDIIAKDHPIVNEIK